MSLLLLTLTSLFCHVEAQSVKGWGSAGGNGSTGGIGDLNNPVQTAQAFITDQRIPQTPNSSRQLARGDAPVLSSSSNQYPWPFHRAPHKVVVDSAHGAQQEMIGFGHSWTDSAVHVFDTLEPDVLDQVMEDLFGQSGNNMGFMRHTIGSSDLSGVPYTYDDNGSAEDLELEHFNITKYGWAMAEMIAKMGRYKSDVFLFGSPWSPPGWMKHNGLMIAPDLNQYGGQAYNLMNNSFNVNYTPQLVTYFAKYVDTFKKHGVAINGMSPQNEPFEYQGGYPTNHLDAVDAANMILNGLGEQMHDRGVKILGYDHNTDNPAYPARMASGSQGGLDGIAWHCYGSPAANFSVMDDFHYAFPDIPQFMTECSNYRPQAGTLNFQVAQNFISPVQNGASGASMWVMATDENYGPHTGVAGCNGCSGSIIVHNSKNYTKTADYYNIGQFSRFIRRGAINYKVPVGNQGIVLDWQQFWIVAFKNPDASWAIVFLNSNNTDKHVELSFTGNNQTWNGVVPAYTLTTWLLPSESYMDN